MDFWSVSYGLNEKARGNWIVLDDVPVLHCEDGPALVTGEGSEHWYYNGMLHRADGPAVIYHRCLVPPNGHELYYWCGVMVPAEWIMATDKRRVIDEAMQHKDPLWRSIALSIAGVELIEQYLGVRRSDGSIMINDRTYYIVRWDYAPADYLIEVLNDDHS